MASLKGEKLGLECNAPLKSAFCGLVSIESVYYEHMHFGHVSLTWAWSRRLLLLCSISSAFTSQDGVSDSTWVICHVKLI